MPHWHRTRRPVAPVVSSTSLGGFSPRVARSGGFFLASPGACGAQAPYRFAEPYDPHATSTCKPADYLKKILTARVYDVAVEIAARAGAQSLSARLRQHGAAQARGPAAGLQLQAARRLQQDGAPLARRSCSAASSARRPATTRRASRSARTGSAARAVDRDAGDHAAGQGRRRARARRRGRAARRQLLRRLRARASSSQTRARPDVRPSVRRPRRDRRPGHDRRWRSCASTRARSTRCSSPIGGGGLISGVAAYIKARAARDQGHRRADDRLRRDGPLGRGRASASTLDDVGLFSDGTAVKLVGEETFRIARELVDDFVVGRHRRGLRRDQGRLRGHAQHPRAGRRAGRRRRSSSTSPRTSTRGETLVAITCGANMNFDRLRFVAERAEVGEEREALFAVTIPEERGSFRRFCECCSPAAAQRHRVQLPHLRRAARRTSSSASPRTTAASRRASPRNFARHGFDALDLTDDELAKEHVRHMVGGRSAAGARRAALPLRVPRAARRADAVPLAACTRTGTSACSTTATRAPTTAASWSGCRCRVRERQGVPLVPRHARLSVRRRDRQPRLPAVPAHAETYRLGGSSNVTAAGPSRWRPSCHAPRLAPIAARRPSPTGAPTRKGLAGRPSTAINAALSPLPATTPSSGKRLARLGCCAAAACTGL